MLWDVTEIQRHDHDTIGEVVDVFLSRHDVVSFQQLSGTGEEAVGATLPVCDKDAVSGIDSLFLVFNDWSLLLDGLLDDLLVFLLALACLVS